MPERTGVHTDTLLTNLSVRITQDHTRFMAFHAFPFVGVQKKSDLYKEYDQGAWFRDEAKERAKGTPAARGTQSYSDKSYSCKRWAFAEDIDREDLDNADAVLNLEQGAMEMGVGKVALKLEREWSGAFFKTSVWSTDLTGVTSSPNATQFIQFDQSASDPVGTIDTVRANVGEKVGNMYKINTMIVGARVFAKLKNNADIKDRVKYTQTGVITQQQLAALFDVMKFLVADATYNTAKEGKTASMSYIHGKHVLLLHCPDRPALNTPSAGYTFGWTGRAGANPANGFIVRKYDLPKEDALTVESEAYVDQKLVAADLGTFLSGAIA